jgi:hypothetical protein
MSIPSMTMDNRTSKLETSAQQYTEIIREFQATEAENKNVLKNYQLALWCLQMLLQEKANHQSKQLIAMDNFYTPHDLAQQIKYLLEGTIFIVRTVRLNLVDALDLLHMTAAKDAIKWCHSHDLVLCTHCLFYCDNHKAIRRYSSTKRRDQIATR